MFTVDSKGGLRLYDHLNEKQTDSAVDLTIPFGSTGLPVTPVWTGLPAKFKAGLAYAYRARFHRDFMIDLVGYRDYIAKHSLSGDMAWHWTDEESFRRYGGQRKFAQKAGLRANTALGLAVAQQPISCSQPLRPIICHDEVERTGREPAKPVELRRAPATSGSTTQ